MRMSLGSFRKIHEDPHSATLMHPSGHKIVVSKASLNEKLKKDLAALPKYMADGGEPEEMTNEMSDQEVDQEQNKKDLDKNYGLTSAQAMRSGMYANLPATKGLPGNPDYGLTDEQRANLGQKSMHELMAAMAAATVRKTPSGRIMGTLEGGPSKYGPDWTPQEQVEWNLLKQGQKSGLIREGSRQATRQAVRPVAQEMIPSRAYLENQNIPQIGSRPRMAAGGVTSSLPPEVYSSIEPGSDTEPHEEQVEQDIEDRQQDDSKHRPSRIETKEGPPVNGRRSVSIKQQFYPYGGVVSQNDPAQFQGFPDQSQEEAQSQEYDDGTSGNVASLPGSASPSYYVDPVTKRKMAIQTGDPTREAMSSWSPKDVDVAPVNPAYIPQIDVKPGGPPMQGTFLPQMQELYKQQEQNVTKEGDVKAELARHASYLQQQHADQMQSLEDEASLARKQFSLDSDQTIQDMSNGHINPNQYIENLSVPGKIATAIGLILGGIGGGMTGQENPAAKFLSQQIDRNINAQKVNLGQKNNLLSAYTHQFNSINDGIIATRSAMQAKMAADIEAAGLRAQDPQARLAAQAMALKFKQESIQTMEPLVYKQSMIKLLQNNPASFSLASMAVPYMVPKELQTEAFKEISKAQQVETLRKQMFEAYNQVNHMWANGLISPTQRSAIINNLAGPIQHLSEGRFNLEAAQNLAASMVPSRFQGGAAKAIQLKNIDNFFDTMRTESILPGHFINMPKFHVPHTQEATVGPNYPRSKK